MQDDAPAVLFAWELGGGLGHVSKGLLLATQLAAADCEVSFAVRDLATTHPLLPDARHRLYQAPVSWAKLQAAPEPANHGELLLHAGFGSSAALAGLVRGWLTLFEADGTRLVIADHAPSAVLAARCAGLPALLFGHGFFAPPAPWPVFRDWEPAPVERMDRNHRHILACVNACLESFGAAPLQNVFDLFADTDSYLCTWPELDHYRARPKSLHDHHLGTVWIDHVGIPADWPAPPRRQAHAAAPRRVFAYLRPGLPGLDDVLAALDQSGASVLVAAPGLSAEVAARWRSDRLAFAPQLVRLADVAAQADLVVCSGSDTLHGMALAGVPVLGLPMNAEQRIAASRLADLRAGRWLLPGSSMQTVAAAIDDLLATPAYREAARALQQRHPRVRVEDQLAPVVAACQRRLRASMAEPASTRAASVPGAC